MEPADLAVRVFISYSHDTPEHVQRVLNFAQQLRAHGVNAQLDQFVNGAPEEGWQRWMQKQIADTTFVLLVCTPTYLRRFDGTESPGQGFGVNWESIITRQELYETPAKNRKFIPVIFDGTLKESVPIVLRQYTIYQLMGDYTKLLRVLLNQPSVVPNTLAAPVQLPGSSPAVQAVIANSSSLPLPIAQTLLRSLNAKSAADIHLSSLHFCHAIVFLSTASYAALYVQFAARSKDIDRELESLRWTEPDHCLEFMAHIAEFFSTHPEHEAGAMFGPVYSRLTAPSTLSDVSWMPNISGETPASDRPSITPLEVLRFVIQFRNAPESTVEMNIQRAAAFRDSVIECYAYLQPFSGCHLAVGTFGSGDTGGVGAYQYLALHGDGLRIPLTVENDIVPRVSKREGILWWIGRQGPLALFPFAVYESKVAGQERVGFIHTVMRRDVAADGRSIAVRKFSYLDYYSGDYLERFDASYELAALLTTLKGHTVSPGEVRSTRAAEPPSTEQISESSTWIGDFELLGEIGRGAMGVVYKARQASLGRLVALKVLPLNLATDPLAIRRFALEVETLGRCDHPNIIKVLTAGKVDQSRYYAMEFIDGSDLALLYSVLRKWKQTHTERLTEGHILAALSSRGAALDKAGIGVLSIPHSLPKIQPDHEQLKSLATGKDYYKCIAELMCGAARGVHHLHSNGIIHRDLKPGNLMVTADGQRTVVMDLGLAKATDQESIPGSSQVKILGTLRYIAPEQLQRNLISLTPRADIYGLGATLYELACLQPIFDGDTEERLTRQVLFDDPERPRSKAPEMPKALELIIRKAIVKDPETRYHSAAELAEDLDSFVRDGFTIHAKPPNIPQRLRKYSAQHSSKVAILAGLLLMIAAGLWIWNYTRVKTVAYASILSRRQIPEGLHQLSQQDWKRMRTHPELQFKGAKVIALRIVNSAGRLTDSTKGISEWRYKYRENGSLEKIEELNHNGIVQTVHRINEDGTTDTFENRGGDTATVNTIIEGGTRKATEIERFVYEYDSRGWPASIKYQNRKGAPRPDTDGNYGALYEVSADGLPIRIWKLDRDGSKKLQRNGVLETRIERNSWGDPVRECYFGEGGGPASNENGVSCIITERDNVSNPVAERYVDIGGKPVISRAAGCASFVFLYTSAGFLRERQCLDGAGNPSAAKNGVAIRVENTDALGNLVEIRNLGPDRRPTYDNQGFSVSRSKFDAAGAQIEVSYFGMDEQPVHDKYGRHRIDFVYEHGLVTKIMQYDASNHLTTTGTFMPVATYKYDKAGNTSEVRFYGEDEKPTTNKNGVHAILRKYDNGNRIEESYININENLVIAGRCCAVIISKYDERGNEIERSFLGTHREPILLEPEGVHGWSSVFDEFGQQVKQSYFGLQHEDVLYQKTANSYTYKYNQFGQAIEAASYGLGGIPVVVKGVHRWRRLFDQHGNPQEISFFGAHDEPVLSQEQYHSRKSNYDQWGHLTDERYYGTHNEPVLDSDGIHHQKLTYDARGHITEFSYFDESEHPCSGKDGYHKRVQVYNARGFLVEESFYGDNGQPVKNKLGEHKDIIFYDDRGNETERRFYDERGKLVVSDGRAIIKTQWDIRGNEMEVFYYGTDEKLILRKLNHVMDIHQDAKVKRRYGVARAKYTYDSTNRRILEEFFGADNKPVENIFGTARVEFTYGRSGRPIEKWLNLKGASVPVKDLEPPPS